MVGERIIPLTAKDKRKLRRALVKPVIRASAQLGVVALLVMALVFFRDHVYNRFFIGASIVLYASISAIQFFKDKSEGTIVRILRDWNTGKKRVIHGRIEKVEFRDTADGESEQVYDIGPYRFALHQMSPVLKRFRQVMPGQLVEVHQCLHSGLVLKIEAFPE